MDRKNIKKGMILCAGLGTRLLPITERFPKPLVPILNVPNLLHVTHLLEQAGVKEVILNLYHLPERIEEFIADQKSRLKFSFSKEAILLGTGGGVKKAEAFFEKEHFVLANCDFVTNAPLDNIIQKHFALNSLATMVLFKDTEREKLYSQVGVDEKGHLCRLPKLETKAPAKTGIFTGLHVLASEVLHYLEERPCGINEILYPALMKEKPDSVHGIFPDNFYWYDTGEIPTIHSATLQLLELLKKPKSRILDVLNGFDVRYQEKKPGVWLDEDAELPANVEIRGPVLIGRGCIVERNVKIGPHVVLGDNSTIGENCVLTRTITLNGSRIEKDKVVGDAVVFEGSILPAKRQA